MRYIKYFVIITIFFTTISLCETPSRKKNGGREPSDVMVSFAKRIKQGFNLRVWMSNQMTLGLEAWDNNPPDGIGLEYPAGLQVEHLYGAGPRIGAIINGVIRVTEGYNGNDARKEFLPEYTRIVKEHFWRTIAGSNAYDVLGYSGYYYNHSIIVNRIGIDDDGDSLIDEDELDGTDNDGDWNPAVDDVGADGLPDSIEVSCDGVLYDPVTNPDPAGDDYDPAVKDKCHPNPDGTFPYKNNKDIWTEKNGISDHGEPNVDEDYGAVSNNDLYCSATDTFRTPIISSHVPMGAKVFQKSYAWQTGTSADAIVFLDYKFINLNLSKTWQDAYIGFFADMDIGPISVPLYAQNNYAAYDSATQTAYVHNPVDIGSTPLGLTLLETSKSLDTLKTIFQWSDFTHRVDPGTHDSAIYSWMSGDAFPGQLIAPNQSVDSLSDTRIFISNGPFQVNPSDTVKVIYALVSGYTIDDMLNNARRAHRIYTAGGFIMPVAVAYDSGNGTGVQISWNAVTSSPFGNVNSYRVYSGTTSKNYTDSVTVPVSNSLGIPGLIQGQNYYFTVAAIDINGNIGARSDEMMLAPSNLPRIPSGVNVTIHDRNILVGWNKNIELDWKGYNIYRATSTDTTFIKLNSTFLISPEYTDGAVWGDKSYIYKVTAVDNSDNESDYSSEVVAHLIPPAVPVRILLSPGKKFLKIQWNANTESDLAGYNIYRSIDSLTGYMKINSVFLTKPFYVDSNVVRGKKYYYYVNATDSTDGVSDYSAIVSGHTVTMDKGILVVNVTSCSESQAAADFYSYLLAKYPHTVTYMVQVGDSSSVYELGNYSTVLWVGGVKLDYSRSSPFACSPFWQRYPVGFKQYIIGGGNLLIADRVRMRYLSWLTFMSEVFDINLLGFLPMKFIGAYGENGFPSVMIDSLKLLPDTSLSGMDRCSYDSTDRILYRYHSDPYDSVYEGWGVGFAAKDSTLKAYYLGFPLYSLDTASAQALIDKVLGDFGEVTGVADQKTGVPIDFRLYQSYPNPFNPATKIQFDIPKVTDVSLIVYDVLGREVARLVDESKPPGHYEIVWDGSRLASGVYFYRLHTTNFIAVKKMLLVR